MILGYANADRHYKGFGYDGGHGGPYWLVGYRAAGMFANLADLKRYVDENLWNCPRNAGG